MPKRGIDGAVTSTAPSGPSVSLPPDRYRCTGNTLIQSSTQSSDYYHIELHRVVQ